MGAEKSSQAGAHVSSDTTTGTPFQKPQEATRLDIHRYPARTGTRFRRLFSVIREYLDALDSGRFNYRPGLGCSMCDFCHTHYRKWAG